MIDPTPTGRDVPHAFGRNLARRGGATRPEAS